MSVVTIKWNGENEEQASSQFEYGGGYGMEIYRSIVNLLTAIEDNFKSLTKGGLSGGRIEEYDKGVRDEIARMRHMVESCNKIHEIMELPNETDKLP